jgi:hypothetical protein
MLYPTYFEGASPRRHPISFASHRERIFCKDCNYHFKHLEDEAADLVTWMAKGRPIQLGSREQSVLARWGAKTAYALIAAEEAGREAVPLEHRTTLREQNVVHPYTWIGYTAWGGRVHKAITTLDYELAGFGTVYVFNVILTFRSLLLKVSGFDKLMPGHEIGSHDAVGQVTPRVHRVIPWPNSPVPHDRDLRRILELVPINPTAQSPKPPITP